MELKGKLVIFLACLVLSSLSAKKKNKKQSTKEKIELLSKHALMQWFYVEETARNTGHSGLKAMRLRNEGTRPYHGSHYADDFTCSSTHDHSDFVNTCGMGEIVAVLNGIEFKSRHNDFLLVKKSTKTRDFGDVEEIPYPDVPQSVLDKPTLQGQINELREYVRAWVEQDDSIKDYKPYFKANLCYMEGAWTLADPDTIQEAFFSERHWFEADSWNDLFQKTRFSSYSGTKDNLENYAFMPRTLWEIQDNGNLVFGQWNYRIFCHPLANDLPLNRLRAVDDIKTRMSTLKTFDEYTENRNARFQINPVDSDNFFDGPTRHGLLDNMMFEVPGMDNYGQRLEDDQFNNVIREFTATVEDPPLNVANYHRVYQNQETGAMGIKFRHRGFNDENMWVAMNTRDNILPIRVENCYTNDRGKRNCESWEQKWSYAIPMEIIYTTPLNSWNPHNILYKGFDKDPLGQTVFEDENGNMRDGSNNPKKAFNGTNSSKYYLTPVEFYSIGELGVDPADTPRNFVFVLDQYRNVRQVTSSGIRTFLPRIPGIDKKVRTRYMIPTVYGEGDPIMKELQALKDIVLNPDRFNFMLTNDQQPVVVPVLRTLAQGPAGHEHIVTFNAHAQEKFDAGETVEVTTSVANTHTHKLVVQRTTVGGEFVYTYLTCGTAILCIDRHPNRLE